MEKIVINLWKIEIRKGKQLLKVCWLYEWLYLHSNNDIYCSISFHSFSFVIYSWSNRRVGEKDMKTYTVKRTITETNFYCDENIKVSLVVKTSPEGKEVKLVNEKDEKAFVFKTLLFDTPKKEIWLRVLKLLEKVVKGLDVE